MIRFWCWSGFFCYFPIYLCQLSLLFFTRWEMSSSLWAMTWRPSVGCVAIGVVVCLLAAPQQFHLFDGTGNRWLHNLLWYLWFMPISCHFWDWPLISHVSSAVAIIRLPLLCMLKCYNNRNKRICIVPVFWFRGAVDVYLQWSGWRTALLVFPWDEWFDWISENWEVRFLFMHKAFWLCVRNADCGIILYKRFKVMLYLFHTRNR